MLEEQLPGCRTLRRWYNIREITCWMMMDSSAVSPKTLVDVLVLLHYFCVVLETCVVVAFLKESSWFKRQKSSGIVESVFRFSNNDQKAVLIKIYLFVLQFVIIWRV
jgi:hypothetical protein